MILDRIPWVAPEVLEAPDNLTLECDKWSFGATVWDIFNNGNNPLQGLELKQVLPPWFLISQPNCAMSTDLAYKNIGLHLKNVTPNSRLFQLFQIRWDWIEFIKGYLTFFCILFQTEGAVCLTSVLPNSVPTLNHDRARNCIDFSPYSKHHCKESLILCVSCRSGSFMRTATSCLPPSGPSWLTSSVSVWTTMQPSDLPAAASFVNSTVWSLQVMITCSTTIFQLKKLNQINPTKTFWSVVILWNRKNENTTMIQYIKYRKRRYTTSKLGNNAMFIYFTYHLHFFVHSDFMWTMFTLWNNTKHTYQRKSDTNTACLTGRKIPWHYKLTHSATCWCGGKLLQHWVLLDL